jgi:hypothetical protein
MIEFTIQINYKTGRSVEVKCSDYTVRMFDGELSLLQLSNPEPRGLFYGLDNIESIYKLAERDTDTPLIPD